jgi:hypothetical protein
VRDLDATQDERAAFDELVDIVSDADMDHGRRRQQTGAGIQQSGT